MKLSAQDTRRVNNLGKNNVIYSSSRSAIFKNEDTFEKVSLCLKLGVEEDILKIWLKHFQLPCRKKKLFKEKN